MTGVLEHHHASTTFTMLQNDAAINIFASLDEEGYTEVRRNVIDAILATDMKHHFELTVKVKQKSDFSLLSRSNVGDRLLLITSVLHAADIGNVVLPPQRSLKWSKLVCDEFQQQADREREEGLDVTPFMACRISAELFFSSKTQHISQLRPGCSCLQRLCDGSTGG